MTTGEPKLLSLTQGGHILLDRVDLGEVSRVVLDCARFGSSNLTTFVTLHG